MSFSISLLTTEIQTDPSGLGYASLVASGADSSIAALINTQQYAMVVEVPAETFKTWAAGQTSGSYPLLCQIAYLAAQCVLTATPTAAQQAGFELNWAIGPGGVATMSSSDAWVSTMFGKLQSAGVLTAAQVTALQALCAYTGSRAEVLWGQGTVVTSQQIAQALGR